MLAGPHRAEHSRALTRLGPQGFLSSYFFDVDFSGQIVDRHFAGRDMPKVGDARPPRVNFHLTLRRDIATLRRSPPNLRQRPRRPV